MPQILLPDVFFEQRYKGTNFWWINQIFKRLFSLKNELFLRRKLPAYPLTHLGQEHFGFYQEQNFNIILYIILIYII